jgi:hypothetical protein
MNDNLYALEKLNAAYRQRREQEAEHSRLLHEIRAQSGERPAWCPVALTLARGLIALGQRLQALAEPKPQPACETC